MTPAGFEQRSLERSEFSPPTWVWGAQEERDSLVRQETRRAAAEAIASPPPRPLAQDVKVEVLARELSVSYEAAERFFADAASGWRGFFTVENGLARQTHGIKGLKIYYLPETTDLVADFAIGVIDRGMYKQVKFMVRVGQEGFISRHVRLTALMKNPAVRAKMGKTAIENDKSFFAREIAQEKAARRFLSGVANIVDMMVIRYISGKGVVKERCSMEKYPLNLFYVIKTGERDRALCCSRGVLAALKGMHARHWVHGDVKPSNILVSERSGCLIDFGLFCKENTPFPVRGNPSYMAPETMDWPRTATAKMDMFSFGILLLAIVKGDKWAAWTKTIQHLHGQKNSGRAYLQAHAGLLHDLRRTSDRLQLLIAELLSFNPENRPSAEETEERLGCLFSED